MSLTSTSHIQLLTIMDDSAIRKQRGSPRVHDVDREKSFLSFTEQNFWRCGFNNCNIAIKNLNNARKHVRKHFALLPRPTVDMRYRGKFILFIPISGFYANKDLLLHV